MREEKPDTINTETLAILLSLAKREDAKRIGRQALSLREERGSLADYLESPLVTWIAAK